MKNNLLLCLLILLIGCSEDTYESMDNLDIILVVGQSNTHYGLGQSNLDAPNNSIVQLGRFGSNNLKVISAVEPLEHHSAQLFRIGFSLTFAKQYLTNYLTEDRKVIIVPCGQGGTGFTDNYWNKGDELYEDAVLRVQHIIDNGSNNRLEAILWHQGESDVGNPNYQTLLDTFITSLRIDLNAAYVPFILGGMVPEWVNLQPERMITQQIIKETVDRVPLTAYVDPTIPFIIERDENSNDIIHYNAVGQRELGRRYFQAYEDLN